MTSLQTLTASPTTTAPARSGWRVALAGLVLVVTGMAAVLALHVLPATSGIDWYRRTISEYAYSSLGWVFDVSVVLISAGSMLIAAGLWLSHGGRRITVGSVATLLWSAALIVLVVFPKHDWSVGPSTHGAIHRVASVIAFASLPVAAIAVGIAHRRRVTGWLSIAFGVVSGGLLMCIVYAALFVRTPWWQVFPLGLIERGIAGFAVLAVICMALSARVPVGYRTQNSLPSGSANST